MFIAGVILVLLGLFGVLRVLTLPLGVILVVVGVIWDLLYFAGHSVALLF